MTDTDAIFPRIVSRSESQLQQPRLDDEASCRPYGRILVLPRAQFLPSSVNATLLHCGAHRWSNTIVFNLAGSKSEAPAHGCSRAGHSESGFQGSDDIEHSGGGAH